MEREFVLAIDFGTTYSGYAFAARSAPDDVYTWKQAWPDELEGKGILYPKTSTSLLYKRGAADSYDLQSWGWTAVVTYRKAMQESIRLNEDPRDSPYYLVQKFKLLLSNHAEDGEPLPDGLSLEQVIADYLHEIGEFALEHMKDELTKPRLSFAAVQVCITVPSLWSDKSKGIMKAACKEAGLDHNDDVLICLEPEAASLYCQKELGKKVPFSDPDTKFLVVDLGGGTVDLVLHKIEPKTQKIRDCMESTGDNCGGDFVNKALEDLLTTKWTFFDEVKRRHPYDALRLMRGFEIQKATVKGEGDPDNFIIDIESEVIKQKIREAGNRPDERRNMDNLLVLTKQEMISAFEGVMGKVNRLIDDSLLQVPSCRIVLLVGGFAESRFLRNRLRSRYPDLRIEKPVHAGSAIVIGATIYALEPNRWHSRRAKKTYGVAVSRPFDETIHSSSRRFINWDGREMCKNCFAVYVKKGAEVPVDDLVEQTHIYPPDCKQAETTILSTDKLNPMYTDDVGVTVECTFNSKLSPKKFSLGGRLWTKAKGIEVKRTLKFGGTMISLTCTPVDRARGKVVETTDAARFLSST